jgi:hypothetical protein
MDYTQLSTNNTKTIVKSIIVGAIGFSLVSIWNTTVTQIINIVYPLHVDNQNKYKQIVSHIAYALIITLIALLIIKILI